MEEVLTVTLYVTGPAATTPARHESSAPNNTERGHMLIQAPRINHWCEVDRCVRRILELHIDGGRLARHEAGYCGHCQVRHSAKGVCSVNHRHAGRERSENDLKRSVNRTAADVADRDRAIECLTYSAVSQPRRLGRNLVRRQGPLRGTQQYDRLCN